MEINKIEETIFKAIDELNDQLSEENQLTKSSETVLYGKNGHLDSLGLVNLLVIIEQNIEDKFNQSITIADERAVSQNHSPFKTIDTLVIYIQKLLKEIANNN